MLLLWRRVQECYLLKGVRLANCLKAAPSSGARRASGTPPGSRIPLPASVPSLSALLLKLVILCKQWSGQSFFSCKQVSNTPEPATRYDFVPQTDQLRYLIAASRHHRQYVDQVRKLPCFLCLGLFQQMMYEANETCKRTECEP